MKKTFFSIMFGGAMLGGWMLYTHAAQAATLALSPASQTVTVGNTFTVNIILDTAGQGVYGVDIYSLHYDPTMLQVQDADSGTAGVQIQAGTLMTDLQYNTVNTTAGTIQFSQTASATGSNYNGVGTLASITFQALKSGTASVTFDFTSGSTVDTNVASLYSDVLTGVTNGSYTLNNASDTTAPSVPTNLAASAASSTAISLTWTASTDPTVAGQTTSGVAGYKIYRGTSAANAGNTQIGTSTTASFTNTGLTAGTTYYYKIAAYDSAGNTSAQTAAVSATTSTNPDTTAPSVPTGVTATAQSTTAITVSWTASTDPTVGGQSTSGVSGYRVFRGGTQIGTSASTSYNDTGLSAATSYSYTVAAYDGAGNVSAQSTAASATTLSNPDTTAPTVSVTSPSQSASVNGTITVSATASDPTVAGQVTSGMALLTVTLDGATFATSSTGSLSKQLDTSTLTNTTHTLVATARDAAGNQASSASIVFTVFNLSNATRYPRLVTLSTMEGLSSVPANQAITAYVLSGSTVVSTQSSLTQNASGQYTVAFAATDPQTVDIRISVPGYLSRKLTGIDTTINSASALSVTQLLAGDFNSDNAINSLDYSVLNSHWLQNYSSADVNRDGLVNSLDYAVMKNNYGKAGE